MNNIAHGYGVDTEFQDVERLCLKWQVASVCGELPAYEKVALGSLGRLADDVALVGHKTDRSFEILYAGDSFEHWLGRPLKGLEIERLGPNYVEAFLECLDRARQRGAPAMSLARCVRDGLVVTCEIVAFPLANKWGSTLFLVFARERSPKYKLVDAIYRATDDGLVTLAAIYDTAKEIIDLHIVSLNDGATRILGGSEQDLRWRRLSEVVPSWRENGMLSRLSKLLGTKDHDEFEVSYAAPAGELIHLRVSASPIGDLIGITLTNITPLKAREASFRLLFENNPMPMWVYDPQTLRFLAVNDAAVAHYGFSREEFLTSTLLDIYVEEEWGRSPVSGDLRSKNYSTDRIWLNKTADGRTIEVQNYARELAFADRQAILLAIVDVTEQREVAARIVHMAHHDPLTGLANRVLFRARLTERLEELRRGGRLAVFYVDLDGFKDVNDAFGHPTGDKLLVAVADRLKQSLPACDVIARVGGDEFAIVQFGPERDEDVCRFAGSVVEAIRRPYDIDGHEMHIGASVGISIAPSHSCDADTLLQNADIALYRAKRDGRGVYRFFEPEMVAAIHMRRALEADLRQALIAGEFELHYQPLIDVETREIVAFEALLRWFHPVRGNVSPNQFIGLAEDTGLIVPIGDWALRRACEEAAKWPESVSVSVNLSPAQFKSRSLVQSVVSALASSGLPADRLELEITETVLLAENNANIAVLHQLRSLGARISMDDFGTGYSSLSYLRSFPFDKIKIDRSFVKELPDDHECAAIVRAVVGMGRCLGVATVAEGVETMEQLACLRKEGCTQVQGFLFSRPAPADQIRSLFEKFRESREAAA